MKEKSNAQKNPLLKNAQANATSNFFKRVFFSPTQEKLFSHFLFFIFFATAQQAFCLTSEDTSSVKKKGIR